MFVMGAGCVALAGVTYDLWYPILRMATCR